MDQTDSGSYPIANIDIGSDETQSSAATLLDLNLIELALVLYDNRWSLGSKQPVK